MLIRIVVNHGLHGGVVWGWTRHRRSQGSSTEETNSSGSCPGGTAACSLQGGTGAALKEDTQEHCKFLSQDSRSCTGQCELLLSQGTQLLFAFNALAGEVFALCCLVVWLGSHGRALKCWTKRFPAVHPLFLSDWAFLSLCPEVKNNQHVWVIKRRREKKGKKWSNFPLHYRPIKNYSLQTMNNRKVGADLIWNYRADTSR